MLALRTLRLDQEDEVIVPAMTFVASLEAVVHAGGVPVIADVDDKTLLLSEEAVAKVRTRRTKAVLPVHLYGHVVPFDAITAWKADGLHVIEDAAQAHLASWRGQPVGTASEAACFSFYPGKNLGALGDGGAVASMDDSLLKEVQRLRDHGRRSKYEHDVIGWCSRLDGIQAAVLEAKLCHLPTWNERRVRLACHYADRLGPLLVPWEEGAVHHLLVVRLPADRRASIQATLARQGVETGIHYPVPLSRQPSCARWAQSCPRAEQAASEVLSLPMDPLMSDDDVDIVSDALEDALALISS